MRLLMILIRDVSRAFIRMARARVESRVPPSRPSRRISLSHSNVAWARAAGSGRSRGPITLTLTLAWEGLRYSARAPFFYPLSVEDIMKTACLALVAVLATASAFAPVPSSRVARASPQSRARVVVAEGTYWEGEAPPSKVLGNLAGAPSILLGPASGVFLLIGLYCVASSQIFQVRALSPCWGSGRRLTFFLSPCFAADERVEHEPLLYRGLNLRAGLVGTSRGRLDPEEERVVGLDAVCAVTRGSGRERAGQDARCYLPGLCARARPCSPRTCIDFAPRKSS